MKAITYADAAVMRTSQIIGAIAHPDDLNDLIEEPGDRTPAGQYPGDFDIDAWRAIAITSLRVLAYELDRRIPVPH